MKYTVIICYHFERALPVTIVVVIVGCIVEEAAGTLAVAAVVPTEQLQY